MIKVIGTENCNRCMMVKNMLNSTGIKYDYSLFSSLDENYQNTIMDMAKSQGISSFPIIIKDNKIIDVKELMSNVS